MHSSHAVRRQKRKRNASAALGRTHSFISLSPHAPKAGRLARLGPRPSEVPATNSHGMASQRRGLPRELPAHAWLGTAESQPQGQGQCVVTALAGCLRLWNSRPVLGVPSKRTRYMAPQIVRGHVIDAVSRSCRQAVP